MSEVVILKAYKTNKVLPPGYKMDHDPDLAVLRRADGSVVAYFPMWSFMPVRMLEAAEEDLARGGCVWERWEAGARAVRQERLQFPKRKK
jgi:hypothetical protein